MKTKITALLLALLMLFSLASCKEAEPDEPKKEENTDPDEFAGPLFMEELSYDYDLSEYITLPEHSALEISCTLVETTDEAVDTVIEEQLASDGESTETADPAQRGNMVIYDCVGRLIEGGDIIEQASGRTLIIGGSAYLDGFTENFIGLKKGDSHTFQYIYPMDFYVDSMAGAAVVYEVSVTSVKNIKPAEFTDDYVRSLEIEGINTTKDYREYIRKLHAERAAMENEQAIRDKIYAILVNGATVHGYPEQEYNYYYNICDKTNNTYATINGITVEAYINQNYGSMEAYEAYAKDYSESHVLEDMIMWSLAREYGVEVDREEYLAEMEYGYETQGANYNVENKAEFENVFGYDVSEGILLKNVLNAVAEDAVINGK